MVRPRQLADDEPGFTLDVSATPEQVVDGWRYFGYAPAEGQTDADMARTHILGFPRIGAQRELLEAMRDRIAIAVEDVTTPARDLAALTKRLADVAREIEALEARELEEVGESARTATDGSFDASAI